MNATICLLKTTMENDQPDWVAGLQRGDPDILDLLIETHQHRLFRYLLSLIGDRAAAEDVFQETWLRVLVKGHQFKAQWKFENWLFSIARHLVIDQARRRKLGSLDQLMDGTCESVPLQLESSQRSPFDRVQAGEASEQMLRAVALLAPLEREVLVLRFQEDLSLEEIAAITQANLSTVKSRLYRSLDRLRRLMTGVQS